MIRDFEFFVFLERHLDKILCLDQESIQEMIFTCCRIKAEVVAADERESDLRRILNFGHTIGHAVEAASDFSIIHGLAVAIGMVAALRLAVACELCKKSDAGRVAALINAYGLPTEIPTDLDRERIKKYLLTDKKTVAGSVFYVLPTTIGSVVITNEVSTSQVDAVLSKR